MRTAGIWHTRRSLVAVIVQPNGRGRGVLVTVPRTPEGRDALAAHLAADPYLEVVVPVTLLHVDPIGRHLRFHRVAAWRVPDKLLHAVVELLQVDYRAAPTLARALARLPSTALGDGLVQGPVPDPRQLELLDYA
jgi:hypothetical protein